jgi:hypothetical protein
VAAAAIMTLVGALSWSAVFFAASPAGRRRLHGCVPANRPMDTVLHAPVSRVAASIALFVLAASFVALLSVWW